MAASVKGKKSLYFPPEMSAEIEAEARRLDRSESWVLQKAWTVARSSIARIPPQDCTPEERIPAPTSNTAPNGGA